MSKFCKLEIVSRGWCHQRKQEMRLVNIFPAIMIDGHDNDSTFWVFDETDCGNYRLVSLLSVPSKIMQSEVNDNSMRHAFRESNLVSDRQWSYLAGHSTELLLIHLTETWRAALDFGEVLSKSIWQCFPRYIENETETWLWHYRHAPWLD